jgi:hypothetical protein
MASAHGSFDVTITPGTPELAGQVARFELAKTFRGDLEGTGAGVMFSAGDPQAGEAGYVAIETVEGALDGVAGGFALQQFGTVHGGEQVLHYEITPGSGLGGLTGIAGTLALTIDADGRHTYLLDYSV